MIEDVHLKQLVTHTNKRGYFRELIRSTDEFFDKFGQLSHSKMETGCEKYGHIHQIQTDLWYIFPLGLVAVQLNDMREESPTFGQVKQFWFGETKRLAWMPQWLARLLNRFLHNRRIFTGPAILVIPPGVAHGLKVFEGPAHLIYATSHIYNPDDEGRIPIDEIDYDWG